MAYSDYGGYAYRNGVHVMERSDAVVTGHDIWSTPGMWPGFATLELPSEFRGEFLDLPRGHAVLGDGPIYVALNKQSNVGVYRLTEEIDILSILQSKDEGAISSYSHSGGSQQIPQ